MEIYNNLFFLNIYFLKFSTNSVDLIFLVVNYEVIFQLKIIKSRFKAISRSFDFYRKYTKVSFNARHSLNFSANLTKKVTSSSSFFSYLMVMLIILSKKTIQMASYVILDFKKRKSFFNALISVLWSNIYYTWSYITIEALK